MSRPIAVVVLNCWVTEGSIRRECLDHIVVFGERNLCHVLLSYMHYYDGTRHRLVVEQRTPISRAAEAAGRILTVQGGGEMLKPMQGNQRRIDSVPRPAKGYSSQSLPDI